MRRRGSWGDVYYRGEDRIQEDVIWRHYRLLDHHGRLVRRGPFTECVREAQQRHPGWPADSAARIGVVLLHGVLRSSRCFGPMLRQLAAPSRQLFLFDYPSTRISIAQAAAQLQRALESLKGFEEIQLVGHSMGGLVIRCWFGQFGARPDRPPVGRIVMLGTPNQGAELADYLSRFPPYRWLFGGAGLELGTRSVPSPQQLAIPDVPFGVIAGGRGAQTRGYNPFLPGDDDGTVTVARTHLAGEADFLRVPVMHRFLMTHPTAIAAVKNFLETGRFGEMP